MGRFSAKTTPPTPLFAGGYALAQDAEALGAAAPFLRASQRAFIDAASLALPSAVSPVFFFGLPAVLFGVALPVPFTLAQRALAAAAIFARPAADMVRLPLGRPMPRVAFTGAEALAAEAPRIELSFSCKASICSRRRRACRIWALDSS